MITLRDYIEKIKRLSNETALAARPIQLAAGSTIGRFSKRVFQDGKTITGGQYQYNDTNPLYVDPDKTHGNTSRLRPPRGKHGQEKFKSGKSHETTWVESYKKLKQLVERESGFVNWVAFGDLKSEIENRSLIKISEVHYKMAVNSDENSGKLKELIRKYPGVFQMSPEEESNYYKRFNQEFLKLFIEKLQ